jgi:type IV conjugative transfer system protein TraL
MSERDIVIREIPRHIGGSPKIFVWELDEVIVFGACFAVGIITRELTWMVLLSFLVVRLFSNWKMGQLPGILAHMAYWHGFSQLNNHFKRGDVREYLD